MDLRLKGSKVLVTGSSRGLGRAIAEAFLAEGSSVCITGRSEEPLVRARRQLARTWGGTRVMAFPCDVTQEPALDQLALEVRRRFQRLDVLVCNVGFGRSTSGSSFHAGEWLRSFQVNLFSVAATVEKMAPLLKRSRIKAILLISSIAGREYLGAPLAYSSAKSALNAFGKNYSKVLAKRGIRLNVLCPGNLMFPGSTWEEKMDKTPGKVKRLLAREVPLGRFGRPEEIAKVALFLCSPVNSFMLGSIVTADGGQTRS